MRPLDDLDISPPPWEAERWQSSDDFGCDIRCDSGSIAEMNSLKPGDELLIKSAPELYECLHEAVIEFCHNFSCCGDAPGYACNGDGCFVTKWRDALARASGAPGAELSGGRDDAR